MEDSIYYKYNYSQIWHLQKTRPKKKELLNKLIAGELSPSEVCQQQNPRAELFVTEGITTVVDTNPVQLININFGPIDMVLMDASNVIPPARLT